MKITNDQMKNWVGFCFLIVLSELIGIGQCRSISSNLKYLTRESNCSWIKLAEEDTDFAGHEYIVAENCLYYYLQDKSNEGQRASPSMLQIAAPVASGINATRIVINIEKVEVGKVFVEEGNSKATLKGRLKVSWRDVRVKWDVDEWKLNSLRIISSSHIWNPGFHPARTLTINEFGYANMQSLVAYPNGSVTGFANLNIQVRCDADFANFPYDRQTCCFNLYSPNFQSVVSFQLSSSEGSLSKDFNSAGWMTTRLSSQVNSDDGALRTCMTLERESGTVKVELTVPAAVSALVLLSSVLFGNIKRQILAKLFALLLQFLSFQFLVQRTPNLGACKTTPKIYIYYEFTLAFTLASTIISALLYALSRRKAVDSAVSESTKTFCQRLNAKLYFCIERSETDETYGTVSELLLSVNVLVSVLIIVSYFIGIIIIFSL